MPGASEQVVAQLSINGVGLEFEKAVTQTAKFLLDDNNHKITGVPYNLAHRVEESIELHRLAVDMQPTPEEVDVILPFLGFSESADVWTPDGVIDSFALKADVVAKVHTYPECYIAVAEWKAQKGGYLELHLEIFGRSLTLPEGAAGSFADAKVAATAPYGFTRGTYKHGATEYEFDQVKIVQNNNLAARFNNNPTFDSAQTTGMEWFVGISTPYTSTEAGIFTAAATDPVPGVDDLLVSFTRSAQELKWVFDNAQREATAPPLTGKRDEVRLPQWWRTYLDDADDLVTITNTVA